jgi:uncharacterized protein
VKFNPKARLDTSQIEDRRGQRGGGMRGGLPVGIPTGGGLVGVVVVLLIYFLSQSGGGSGGPGPHGGNINSCRTGADTSRLQCRLTADVDAVQSFWSGALPRQTNHHYTVISTVLFNGSTSSGCGAASSAMGPFYCPVDKKVYLDTSFFRDMLQRQLGARGGDFADAYVLAHEYGHHVQDLLGTMNRVRTRSGPTSDSVRLELQADCFAGVWAHSAATARDRAGRTFLAAPPSAADIRDAVNAATAVGDDRIQRRTQGHVVQEQWTHGSASERVRWFTTGYRTGRVASCDTFSAAAL